jgi:hypothetical protein
VAAGHRGGGQETRWGGGHFGMGEEMGEAR